MRRPRSIVSAKILDDAISNPEAVPDAQLLTSLLELVRCPRRASLAESLLKRYGDFAELLNAPAAQLQAEFSLSDTAILLLKGLRAATARYCRSGVSSKPILQNWSALLSYLKAAMAHLQTEEFRVVFLGPGNRLITDEVMWTGTINHVTVHSREVVRRALELNAVFLIAAHNHPSGEPLPSQDDAAITRELEQMTDAVSIPLIDHFIIGRHTYTSLRNCNLLTNKNGMHERPPTGMACLPYPPETEPATSALANSEPKSGSNRIDQPIVGMGRWEARLTSAVADPASRTGGLEKT